MKSERANRIYRRVDFLECDYVRAVAVPTSRPAGPKLITPKLELELTCGLPASKAPISTELPRPSTLNEKRKRKTDVGKYGIV